MAVTFLDAAGHYAVGDAALKGWKVATTETGVTCTISPAASPAEQPLYKLTNVSTYSSSRYGSFRRAGPNTATVHMGARYRLGSLHAWAIGTPLMEFVSNGWLCVVVTVTQGGAIEAYRAPWNGSEGWNGIASEVCCTMGTLLGTSATTPITVDGFYYIECEVTLSDDAGVVKVWVNGNLVLNISGVQTTISAPILGGSSGLIDLVGFGAQMTKGTSSYLGEFYVGDAEVGDVRLDTHFPDANGTDRDWTLSTGSDEHDLLDEAEANITDYIETDTVGDQTSVSLEPLRNVGGVIVAVQLVAYLTKQAAGPCCVTPYVLIGGVRYYGDGWYPSWGSWQFYHYVWDTNPAGGDWTESAFNNAEFGVERTA